MSFDGKANFSGQGRDLYFGGSIRHPAHTDVKEGKGGRQSKMSAFDTDGVKMGFQAIPCLFACLDTPPPMFWLVGEVARSRLSTEILGETITLVPWPLLSDVLLVIMRVRVCSLHPEEDRVLQELEKRGNPEATPAGDGLERHGAFQAELSPGGLVLGGHGPPSSPGCLCGDPGCGQALLTV